MIYILEIPHQRPATCWSKRTESEIISAINASSMRCGEMFDTLDPATDYLASDLHACRIYMSDEEALAALADGDYKGHQSGRAMQALRDELASNGAAVPREIAEEWDDRPAKEREALPTHTIIAACPALLIDEADDYRSPDSLAYESASTGNGPCIHMIEVMGCAVSIFDDCGDLHVGIHAAGTTCRDVLKQHEPGYCEMAEYLASYGLTPDLDEADEDHDGPVRIWAEHNYYAGTLGAPADGWLRDYQIAEDGQGRGDVATWESYADAQDWIDAAEEGTYCTSHGEAGAPAYTICKA